MRVKAEIDDLDLPVVLHCEACRYADEWIGGYYQCRCPKQSGWADKVGGGYFTSVGLMRQWECHGTWWEPRLPSLTWWQCILLWLARASK